MTQEVDDKLDQGSDFKNSLSEHLSQFNSAPVLFIGSGISRRYLGLPDWFGLLEKLAEYTNKDFAYYRSTGDNDPAAIASLMANDLHDAIWAPALEEICTLHKDEIINRQSAIKILSAELTKQFSLTADEDLGEEIELLRKVNVDAIITTNYDNLLNDLFPDFKTYIGQDELLISDPQGVGEIYKIHGSVEKPNSIVLTSDDYAAYADRYAYLAAKLMTIFAEHPVIFLGYSLSDPNIINILDSLVKCAGKDHLAQLQNSLIFVQRGEQTSLTSTVFPTSGVSLPVVNVKVPDFKELFEVLGSLERKFPAHILRLLKERIYELVLTNDPSGRLYVDDIENVSSESVDVVLGVGIKSSVGHTGYITYNRMDIAMDVLQGDNIADAKSLLNKTIPPLQGVVPLLKYLKKANYLDDEGNLLNDDDLHMRVKAKFLKYKDESTPAKSSLGQAVRIASQYSSFTALASSEDVNHTLLSISSLRPENVDPDELKAYLIRLKQRALESRNFQSQWIKAVCLYDRLVNLSNPW